MKRLAVVFTVIVFMAALACNNADTGQSKNQKQPSEQKTEEQNTSAGTDMNTPETNKMKARFKKPIFSTDGVIFVFEDKNGTEHELWEYKETKGMWFSHVVEPNRRYYKYETQWFDVSWAKRERDFHDGGTGETKQKNVPVLLSAQALDKDGNPAKRPDITLKELGKVIFTGNEPAWTLTFKDDYISFTEGMGGREKKFQYGKNSYGPTPVKHTGKDEVLVKAAPSGDKSQTAVWMIRISKEKCSDGMSEKRYPYSIRLDKADGSSKLKGCGRIDWETVDIKEIKETKKIKNYVVSDLSYTPGQTFDIKIKGQYQSKGYLTVDPMSEQLVFHVDQTQWPRVRINIEGFKRPVFTRFHFTNENELKKALGKEKVRQIRQGKKYKTSLTFTNYRISGKLDGYGGASAQFLRLAE